MHLPIRKNDLSRLKHIEINEILESIMIFEKGKPEKDFSFHPLRETGN